MIRKVLIWVGLAVLSGLIGAFAQAAASRAADAAQKLWLRHYIQGTIEKHRWWAMYRDGVAAQVETLHGQSDYWQGVAKRRGDEAADLEKKLKALSAAPPPAVAK